MKYFYICQSVSRPDYKVVFINAIAKCSDITKLFIKFSDINDSVPESRIALISHIEITKKQYDLIKKKVKIEYVLK